MVPEKLINALRSARHKVFVVSTHTQPEGDALGAQLALASLLRRCGKKVVCVNQDRPPAEYAFLPDIDRLCRESWPRDYDVCVLVDCSDVTRIGGLRARVRADRLIVNIDHHVSNTRFGGVNWVQPRASSACEMIHALYKAMRVSLRRDEALQIYTGLMTDTGSFRFAGTTARTHAVAADLLRHRLDVAGIYRKVHEELSFAAVVAMGHVVRTLRRSRCGTVAWLTVSRGLLRRFPELVSRTDDLIRFARSIAGVEVAFLFKEVGPGEVRVNLRSCRGRDVNKIARRFGGGGHPMASGCTVRGTLASAVRRLVGAARRST
ncbi:MAG: DHH family phosphoesterase [Deltaproteobacteria bacterium]